MYELKQHPEFSGRKWIAFDDIDLLKGEYKTGEATRDDMIKHFVKTSHNVGLTDKHVEKALALLDQQ